LTVPPLQLKKHLSGRQLLDHLHPDPASSFQEAKDQHSQVDGGDRFQDRGPAQLQLPGDLQGGQLQLKELGDPPPVSTRNPEAVQPPPGEVMEIIAAGPGGGNRNDGNFSNMDRAENTWLFFQSLQ